MFKEGDLVRIEYHGQPGIPMPNSPVMMLEGTEAIVERVRKDKTYQLEFVNVCRKINNYDYRFDGSLNWRDEHLVPVVDEVKEIDMSSIFSEKV